jgi:hypothetical protein
MNFVSCFRSEFAKSERYLYCSLALKVVLFVVSILVLVFDAKVSAKGLLWFAGVVQLFLFLSRWRSMEHQRLAEELRRRAMLKDGLGVSPPLMYEAKIASRVGDIRKFDVRTAGYYTSASPQGPLRLAEITAESAFYSHGVAWTSGWTLVTISALGVAVVVFSFIALVMTNPPSTTLDLASKVAVLAVAFWAADDWIMMAIRLFICAQECDRVLDRCSNLLETRGDVTERDVCIALMEYHAAVSEAGPLPSVVYKIKRGSLDRAWALFRCQFES